MAPTVVTAPAAVTVNVGNTATFAVGVGGTAPTPTSGSGTASRSRGATAAFYSLAAATAGNAGSYSGASPTPPAASPVPRYLSVVDSPAPVAAAITTSPRRRCNCPAAAPLIRGGRQRHGPLAYQWLNGAPIAGATGAVLVLTGVTGGDAAS